MKRLSLITVLLLGLSYLGAQEQRIFLFDEFGESAVYLKNKSVTKSKMNYDANGGKVYFMQGDEMMELTNLMQIDSIHFGDKTFVVKGDDIVENHPMPAGIVQIKWRIHKVHDGYVGAFGTSQVPSKKLQLSGDFGMGTISGATGGMYNGSFGVNDSQEGGRNLDVWRKKSQNTYYFEKNGKSYAVSKMSQLQKAFPEKKKQIKDFAKQYDLNFDIAEKAVILIAYVMALD